MSAMGPRSHQFPFNPQMLKLFPTLHMLHMLFPLPGILTPQVLVSENQIKCNFLSSAFPAHSTCPFLSLV